MIGSKYLVLDPYVVKVRLDETFEVLDERLSDIQE